MKEKITMTIRIEHEGPTPKGSEIFVKMMEILKEYNPSICISNTVETNDNANPTG